MLNKNWYILVLLHFFKPTFAVFLPYTGFPQTSFSLNHRRPLFMGIHHFYDYTETQLGNEIIAGVFIYTITYA